MKITNDFLFLSYISVQKKHSKNFKFAEKQKKIFQWAPIYRLTSYALFYWTVCKYRIGWI